MPKSSIQITQVTAENFGAFLALVADLAEYEHLPPPDQEAQTRLSQDYQSPQPPYYAYIATIKGKSAGYITYYFTYSTFLALPTLFLEDIFVQEDYRKQGVGKALFVFIKQQAKAMGCGRIEFNVLKWNTQAQDFYAENGAKCLDWHIYRIEKDDF